MLLNLLEGLDPADSTSRDTTEAPTPFPPNFPFSSSTTSTSSSTSSNVSSSPVSPLAGLKVGIPEEYMVKELDPAIASLWQKGAEHLEAAGATIVSVSLPHTPFALPTYYILAPSEAASNLSRYDGVRYGQPAMDPIEWATVDGKAKGVTLTDLYRQSRTSGFGIEVQRRIIVGNYVLSSEAYQSYVAKAQQVRRAIVEDFEDVFANQVDVLLSPTSVGFAPTLQSLKSHSHEALDDYFNDIMTTPASLAGLPSISIPFSSSPISNISERQTGLQLIAPAMGEATLLRVATTLATGQSSES